MKQIILGEQDETKEMSASLELTETESIMCDVQNEIHDMNLSLHTVWTLNNDQDEMFFSYPVDSKITAERYMSAQMRQMAQCEFLHRSIESLKKIEKLLASLTKGTE